MSEVYNPAYNLVNTRDVPNFIVDYAHYSPVYTLSKYNCQEFSAKMYKCARPAASQSHMRTPSARPRR